MAPLSPRRPDFSGTASELTVEWTNPSNYAFTVLLLLGGDVVSRALAQLAGGRITPVAFSFGWVAYATSAINSAVGENKLMPDADTPCTVINPKSQQSRGSNSWVLGRIMRDFEHWQSKEVEDMVKDVRRKKKEFDEKKKARERGSLPSEDLSGIKHKRKSRGRLSDQAGLVVSFWKVDASKKNLIGQPGMDLLFWSGIAVYVIQLGIAAIPFGVSGEWGVFLVTAAAIVLCLLTGSHAQWHREKWACREIEPGELKTYILTRGNGAQHALVVQCDGCGLNLEDLCTGYDNLDTPAIPLRTRISTIVLGLLWILLLITSSALTTSLWFLMAIGGIGMLQNIFVAGFSRHPEALGLPLKFEAVVGAPRVITAIYEAEKTQAKVGRALVGTFFPGGIRQDEEEALCAIEEEAKLRKGVKRHEG